MKIGSLLNIEIAGLNQEKIFNKFVDMGIEIVDLIRSSHSTASFSIQPNDLTKVKKILEQNQIAIKSIKKQGFIKYYSAMLLRVGILIGFCLSIILLFISNYFIINIRIYGNEQLSTVDILNFLMQNNVNSFTLKNSVESDELEILLMKNFDKISMVSIIKKGATLIVNIKEKIPDGNETDFENIVSEYNGRITDIRLISGTLKKKAGDIIKVGDILVEGSFIDSFSQKQKITPQAEIKAEVWFEEKIIHYEKSIVTEYTGNEIKLRSIMLFGLELFSNFSGKSFEKFEVKENYIQLKNVVLPLIIKCSIIKELRTFERISQFEDVKDELIEECKQKTLQRLGSNDIIKSEKCTVTPGAGFTVVSYLMIVEKELC